MDREKLIELADFLETLPKEDFDGWEWGLTNGRFVTQQTAHSCGTKACLAGWAVLFNGYTIKDGVAYDTQQKPLGAIGRFAQDLLGLTFTEEDLLFYPTNRSPYSIWPNAEGVNPTPQQAAQAIRNLLALDLEE